MYTDLSLMTADPTIGQDASQNFFKNMSIGNLPGGRVIKPDRITGQLKEPYLYR